MRAVDLASVGVQRLGCLSSLREGGQGLDGGVGLVRTFVDVIGEVSQGIRLSR